MLVYASYAFGGLYPLSKRPSRLQLLVEIRNVATALPVRGIHNDTIVTGWGWRGKLRGCGYFSLRNSGQNPVATPTATVMDHAAKDPLIESWGARRLNSCLGRRFMGGDLMGGGIVGMVHFPDSNLDAVNEERLGP